MKCAIGVILKMFLLTTNTMPTVPAKVVVILVCVFVAGFAWSWGPICWLISSEIYPLETRNAGYFFAVSTNMVFTFVIAQAFLSMLCKMRWGIFFFFTGWLLISLIFSATMLPETKGIPIDEMIDRAWKKHWYWKSYFKNDNHDGSKRTEVAAEIEEKPAA